MLENNECLDIYVLDLQDEMEESDGLHDDLLGDTEKCVLKDPQKEDMFDPQITKAPT